MPYLATSLWASRGKSFHEIVLEREASDLRERLRLKELEAEVKGLRKKLGLEDAIR